MTDLLLAVTRWWCGLTGHDALLHVERDRLSMRCVTCGWESPGWTLREPKHESRAPLWLPRKARG